LGAASLFLALQPENAFLGDANAHLMATYGYLRTDPANVAKQLARLIAEDCEDHYYRVRDEYNNARHSARQAARFIYLNHTCFNGVFRVNRRGQYNVPYGFRPRPAFPSQVQLTQVGNALAGANLFTGGYRQTLASATKGDFVYLDPPYPPLNGTSNFAHYTPDRFGADDQEALAKVAIQLKKRGCDVLISNADTPAIRRLYKQFNIRSLPVTRWVTCKSEKHIVHELLISTY
jgi:DNA adenine methylase